MPHDDEGNPDGLFIMLVIAPLAMLLVLLLGLLVMVWTFPAIH